MPKKDYRQINLTMPKKTHDVIRKAWEKKDIDMKISTWVLDVILLAIKKDEWLNQYAPHLSFIGIDKDGVLLRDKHLRDSIVEVKLLDSRLWCQSCKEKHCMHVYYTIGLPSIAKAQDPEKPRRDT